MHRFLAAIVVAVMFVSACGSQQESAAPEVVQTQDVAPQYREVFDELLAGDLDVSIRKALEDYWVSDDEWNDASSRYLACIQDQGFEGQLDDQKFAYGMSQDSQQKLQSQTSSEEEALGLMDRIVDECRDSSGLVIGMLYFETRSNPDAVDYPELLRRCFSEAGLKDLDGLADQEVLDLVHGPTFNVNASPQHAECMTNPSYGQS